MAAYSVCDSQSTVCDVAVSELGKVPSVLLPEAISSHVDASAEPSRWSEPDTHCPFT